VPGQATEPVTGKLARTVRPSEPPDQDQWAARAATVSSPRPDSSSSPGSPLVWCDETRNVNAPPVRPGRAFCCQLGADEQLIGC
jgi:hypothetical protein